MTTNNMLSITTTDAKDDHEQCAEYDDRKHCDEESYTACLFVDIGLLFFLSLL